VREVNYVEQGQKYLCYQLDSYMIMKENKNKHECCPSKDIHKMVEGLPFSPSGDAFVKVSVFILGFWIIECFKVAAYRPENIDRE